MSNPTPLFPGCYFHIYNRGNNRENIFIEERNYAYFLNLYIQHIEPIAVTYAYCLLRNHFHVLVRIKIAGEQVNSKSPQRHLESQSESLDASQQFGNLFDAYAKAINRAYNRTGSLFQHPFGRVQVRTEAHFVNLITYIHQNPQRHGLIDNFREWKYSSYDALLSTRATHLKRADVLAWFDGKQGLEAAHQIQITRREIASLAPEDYD
jgi:putative transposase